MHAVLSLILARLRRWCLLGALLPCLTAAAHPWYVNPATGNDINDGATPATAWKTATRLQQALDAGTIPAVAWPWQYQDGSAVPTNIGQASLLQGVSSGAIVFRGTDILIDTSGGPWTIERGIGVSSLSGIRLASATPGVPADLRVLRRVGAGWTPVSGSPNVYANADTENYAVLWEDRKWYNHPVGANFAGVAATLSGTPGSFWTDGRTMYVHPFGDTDPRNDGKVYERSRRLTGLSADVGHVVQFLQSPNCVAEDLLITGTALVRPDGNDVAETGNHYGIYCEARNQFIHRCQTYYSEKHGIGIIEGGSGMFGLVEDCVSEQGTPYTGYGGQTPFVAFGMTNSFVHLLRCQCTRFQGLIGSAAGDLSPLAGPAFYTHGITGGEVVIEDGNFAGTVIGGEFPTRLLRTRCFGFNPYNDTGTAEGCRFDGPGPVPVAGATITATNCLFRTQAVVNNFVPRGHIVCDGCTFDTRDLAGTNTFFIASGIFNPQGGLTLTVRNSIFVSPPGVDFTLFFTILAPGGGDVVQLSNNVYLCGPANRLLGYWNGYQYFSYQSPADAQAAGLDSGSLAADPLLAADDTLLPASPALDYTPDRGPSADCTGRVFTIRNDAGCFEYPLPVFRRSAVGAELTEGSSLTLSATVAGNGPFTFQWQRYGRFVPGATSASLTLNGVLPGDSGAYVLVAANAGGIVASPAAVVLVHPRTFSQWETLYFTPAEQADPRVSGPAADPDGDGLSNLCEYAFGANPRTAQSDASLRPQTLWRNDTDGTHLALTYRRLINSTQLTYTVGVSGDLVSWDETGSQVETVGAAQPTGDGRTEGVTCRMRQPVSAAGGGPRFLRLRVSAAP